MTMRPSGTVTEIWRLKDNGVTSLTFWGHVTSSVTKERWNKGKRKRRGEKREGTLAFSFSFGSAKRLSESLSQKVKSPIVLLSNIDII